VPGCVDQVDRDIADDERHDGGLMVMPRWTVQRPKNRLGTAVVDPAIWSMTLAARAAVPSGSFYQRLHAPKYRDLGFHERNVLSYIDGEARRTDYNSGLKRHVRLAHGRPPFSINLGSNTGRSVMEGSLQIGNRQDHPAEDAARWWW